MFKTTLACVFLGKNIMKQSDSLVSVSVLNSKTKKTCRSSKVCVDLHKPGAGDKKILIAKLHIVRAKIYVTYHQSEQDRRQIKQSKKLIAKEAFGHCSFSCSNRINIYNTCYNEHHIYFVNNHKKRKEVLILKYFILMHIMMFLLDLPRVPFNDHWQMVTSFCYNNHPLQPGRNQYIDFV